MHQLVIKFYRNKSSIKEYNEGKKNKKIKICRSLKIWGYSEILLQDFHQFLWKFLTWGSLEKSTEKLYCGYGSLTITII